MKDTRDPKSIVCFGDSLTWGFDPASGKDFRRFGFTERWTRRLQTELGTGYHVIEEGLSGRTTVFDDPVLGGMSAVTDLPNVLSTHMPVDLVAIMLGSNDLKRRFGLSADEVARGLSRVLAVARNSGCGPGGKAPEILVLVPPVLGTVEATFIGLWYDGDSSREASRQLHDAFRPIAAEYGAHCFDTATVVGPGTIDGVHLDADQLQPLAEALATVVRDVFGRDG